MTAPVSSRRQAAAAPAAAGGDRVRRPAVAYGVVALAAWALLQVLWSGTAGVAAFDPDDYMRLVQVGDLMDGAGWYDLHQHRLDPPTGVPMHWTRLPDLPIALVAGLLEGGHGRTDALLAAARIVPAGLLLVLLLAMGWAAAPVLPGLSRLVLLAVLCVAGPVLMAFLPGRVDHHAYHLIAAAVLTGALLRIAGGGEARHMGLLAGLAGAVGLWVSHELAPWLVVFSGALAMDWVVSGGRLRQPLAFAGTLLAAVLAIMPVAHPAADWTAAACDGFSAATVGLAAMIAVFWALLAALGRTRLACGPVRRLGAAGLAGVAAGGGLALLLPDCLASPYGVLDPAVGAVWLDFVKEARPLASLPAGEAETLLRFLIVPALGLAFAAGAAARGQGHRRRQWLALALVAAAGLLAPFYQVRLVSDAALFAAIPAAAACVAMWRWAGRLRHAAPRALLKAAPALGMAAILTLGTGTAGQGDAAAPAAAGPPCDTARAASALAQLPAAAGPLLIAAPIDRGPELLVRTPHAVVAAPYHRGPDGLLAVDALFRATDMDAARAIVDGRGIDIVLVCRAGPDRERYRGAGAPSLVDRLAAGTPPPWLRPLPLPDGAGMLAFRATGP